MKVCRRNARHLRGFTATEILIVVAVIAILAAIAIPFVNSWLQQYRLDIAAQQVSEGLQTAKMQAVAKMRKRELLFDVEGSRVGIDGSELQPLPSGVRFDSGKVDKEPDEGVPVDSPVTFPLADANGSLRSAAFTGRGLPDTDPGKIQAVYVSNTAGTRVVLMTSAGNIRIKYWDGEKWQ